MTGTVLNYKTESIKLAFFGKLCYVLASTFIAYSLIAFYYRLIAESGAHWFRMALHITLGFNIVVWTSMLFAEIFLCKYVCKHHHDLQMLTSCPDLFNSTGSLPQRPARNATTKHQSPLDMEW